MSSTTGLFLPLSIIQGESLDLPFDIMIDGAKVDPTELSFLGQFRLTLDDTPHSFTFTDDDSDPYITHATFPYVETEKLSPGEYSYEIRMRTAVDKVKTIFYGQLNVLPAMVF